MEENENKEVVEETTQEPVEETTDQKQEDSPVSINEDGDYKIDLSKIQTTEESVEETTEETSEEVVEDNTTEKVEEVTEEATEEVEEIVEEAIAESEANGTPLPEDIQKLVDFMEETGGNLDDYVRLNRNIDDMDDSENLHDYYKKTKPHLNNEEINFLLEDQFSYDEEADEAKDIKRKKLALKEQVAQAKTYLDGQKSKYYEEIKAGSKLTKEQQEAVEFFNNYNQEEEQQMEIVKKQQSTFLEKTDKVFNNKFKGFEFDVDGKKMMYNVSNIEDVKKKQVDINNFVGKFLNKNSMMEDAAGYHKSLYTAMNADAIAKHFYEQGKSDAIKDTVSKSKNINTSRESHKVYEGEGGVKFKVLGENSDGMRLKFKKRK